MERSEGLARIEVLVVAVIGMLLLAVVPVACRKARYDAARVHRNGWT